CRTSIARSRACVIDWLLGGEDRRNAARDEAERASAETAWRELLRRAPTDHDLVPEYYLEGAEDEYGDLLGDPSQLAGMDPRGTGSQQTAMEALRQLYTSGGYTDQDAAVARDLRRVSAMERGQALRGA